MGIFRKKVHFIGVSGIGVSATAFLSIKRGYKVTGSAVESNKLVENLKNMGMKFYLGHRKENIDDVDLIVRSAAVRDENPEVKEALRKGIDVLYYSRYLGMLMSEKQGIAIAGTHGKTTTTAMVATILKHSGLEPEVVCGGIMNEFKSNAIYGDGKYFVAEACEYNRSFLDLSKSYGIITNIEADHLDYYGTFENILESFREFIEKTEPPGYLFVNGDDPSIHKIVNPSDIELIKVGYSEKNDVLIKNVTKIDGSYSYNLTPNGNKFNKYLKDPLMLKLKIPGRFNIINSALSSLLALRLGVERKDVEESLRNFKGTERRMEIVGKYLNNPVISDYAHHPTEISVTLDTLKDVYPNKKLMLIFQPHQYSRTAFLFEEFVKALVKADYLVITEIYEQRDSEEYLKMVRSDDLFKQVKKVKREKAFFVKNLEDLQDFIVSFVKSDDYVIIFMGAGSIDHYARSFINT
ncbi:MAG: UDP-N-acetylmuramate--L-alanine ligase [Spirochaetes bacterium]|nr:MAG: UDP-N-acetylmuramate--L-alanine ligase [Spirochaetota bacterium]